MMYSRDLDSSVAQQHGLVPNVLSSEGSVWGHVDTSQVLCEEPSGAGSRGRREELKIQHNRLDVTRALRAGKMGNRCTYRIALSSESCFNYYRSVYATIYLNLTLLLNYIIKSVAYLILNSR